MTKKIKIFCQSRLICVANNLVHYFVELEETFRKRL